MRYHISIIYEVLVLFVDDGIFIYLVLAIMKEEGFGVHGMLANIEDYSLGHNALIRRFLILLFYPIHLPRYF